MFAVLIALTAGFHDDTPKPAEKILRVGNITIEGNIITEDRVILDALNLHPGQVLRLEELSAAQLRLEQLNIFRLDRKQGIRPTVESAANEFDTMFRDIRVKVEETATHSLRVVPARSRSKPPGFALVVEERNFDPFNFPTTARDFEEGRAFRGRALKFQVGIAFEPNLRPRLFWNLGD